MTVSGEPAVEANAAVPLARWRALGAAIGEEDRDLLDRAAAAAAESGAPAAGHALGCATILAGLRLDADTLAAAMLAGVPAGASARIAERFGPAIAALVDGARRMDEIQALRATLPGAGKSGDQAAQLESLRQMLLAMVQDARVVLIKLADQAMRLRWLVRHGSTEARAVAARDTFDLIAPLANRLGVWQLKWELEDLAFRAQDPVTYKNIASELDGKRADREQFIARVTELLRGELTRAGVENEVAGRPKHIYSIWKKMQRKHLGFKDLFDVRAVRIVVRDARDCYTALGIVHNLWTPIPHEFDDYIAKPKANNYRSLHTAVVGPDDKVLEVQIRSVEMHQENELGIAAHWRYKEGGRRDSRLEQQIAWLRRILDWREDMGEVGELANALRTELFHETVYVLTPQGRVIALPRGSTPIDFAYHVHSDLGHRCRGAKVNGVIAPLTQPLQSGQRVEIVTAREGGPSRDWLNPQLGFIRSQRARGKVRQWFNSQNLEHSIAQGRVVLEREVHRLGTATPSLDTLAATLHLGAAADLLAALGRGEVPQRQLQSALRGESQPPEPERQAVVRPEAKRDPGGVLIVGVDQVITQLAGCCKPAPPDAIVGFVTRGRGISVHRADCASLRRLDPERLVTADWGRQKADARFPVDLEIVGRADGVLLRDVTDVAGTERVPVRAASAAERGLECRIALRVEISGVEQLERLMARIDELPEVVSVRRK